MSTAKKERGTKPTSTVVLLFWLMLVISLAGVTLLRLGSFDQIAALWVGSVGGAAVGLIAASLRLRAWIFGAIAVIAFWLSPFFYFVLFEATHGAGETFLLALAPAFTCAYFTKSERWGLASFWYPAMLWMLVVLDGSGRFDVVASLPLLVGLGAMFVAFLRARETRRVALWQGNAVTQLAKPVARHVLRASPVRAAAQWMWAGLVGAGVLTLTVLIAPQLWQREKARQAEAQLAAAAATSDWATPTRGGVPCCKSVTASPESHVREYVSLTKDTPDDNGRSSLSAACRVCDAETVAASDVGGGGYTWNSGGRGGRAGAWRGSSINGGTTSGGYGNGAYGAPYVDPMTASQGYAPYNIPKNNTAPFVQHAPYPPVPVAKNPAPNAPTTPNAPAAPIAADPSVAHPANDPLPPAPADAPIVTSHHRPRVPVKVHLAAAPKDDDIDVPWWLAVVIGLGALTLRLASRAARRQIRLRHLAVPFWREPLDQRISNLWERMLIGLRDAGIQPRPGEQPETLAKRVGLPGMETCATILERARHGVRLAPNDLAEMRASSHAAFHAAREKAGALARAAALVRP